MALAVLELEGVHPQNGMYVVGGTVCSRMVSWAVHG